MYGQLWSFVIMLCSWPVGPLQHGASVLVDARQRWGFGEENDGEFSAVASTFPAWRPPQNGTDGPTYAAFKGDFTFTLRILPFVYRLVVTDSVNWNGEWCGYPGDDEEMLGGKPVCVVSSHSCGSLASLQLSSEPGAQQVPCFSFQQHIYKIIFHSLAWVSRVFLGLKEALYKLQLIRLKDKQILLCAGPVASCNLQ